MPIGGGVRLPALSSQFSEKTILLALELRLSVAKLGSLVDGDRGRDELAAIRYRGCGHGHGIAGRNHGRGLVSRWNIAGDWVWVK